MTPPKEDPPARSSAGAVLLVLALLAVGLGYVAARHRPPAERPQPGNVLLEVTLDLAKAGPAGASRRMRLTAPAVVDVALERVTGPIALSFGPPQAVETAPQDLPDPGSAATVTWTADPTTPRRSFPALAPGMYVLHAEAKGAADPAGVRVTVRTQPAR